MPKIIHQIKFNKNINRERIHDLLQELIDNSDLNWAKHPNGTELKEIFQYMHIKDGLIGYIVYLSREFSEEEIKKSIEELSSLLEVKN